MLVRTALGAFCAMALVTSGLSPAMAHEADDDDVLKVTVCKKVKDNHDDRRSKDKEFDFEAWTDDDEKSFSLEDGDCKKFEFDFDDNKFSLEEDREKGYDVDFRVNGHDEKTTTTKDKVKVVFDDDKDKPRLRIKVINKKD